MKLGMGMGLPYPIIPSGSPIPANALLEDDGVTPLYEDDGVTILLED